MASTKRKLISDEAEDDTHVCAIHTTAPTEQVNTETKDEDVVRVGRANNKDEYTYTPNPHKLRRIIHGLVPAWTLPKYEFVMSQRAIPATPRVTSPSPAPESGSEAGFTAPTTRSIAQKKANGQEVIGEEQESSSEGSIDVATGRKPRPKSRSPMRQRKQPFRKLSTGNGVPKLQDHSLLSPATSNGSARWSWREFSRSPSPLGLIPIHKHFRAFIHKHEVPRKVLHVSIGFFTLYAYVNGIQTSTIPPYLFGALVPIAGADFLRFRWPAFNRFYVKVLGAMMRESEVTGYNGVIWYLVGTWAVLYWLPKDVAVVSVLLLSWCDTAASTFGRAWGRYTPRVRNGKSLAGTGAAFLVGVATAAGFWGYLAPRTGPFVGDEDWPFMFQGVLRLPGMVRNALSLTEAQSTIGGGLALGVMSLVTGLAGALSEVVDVFGWDDNLTIPVLSGIGMWGFLKVFG